MTGHGRPYSQANIKLAFLQLAFCLSPRWAANAKMKLQQNDGQVGKMQVLLFANGEANPGSMVQRVLDDVESPYILCADGGALNALKFNQTPQTIVGDMDSLTDLQAAEFAAQGAELVRYPAEKDETDLELALYWALRHGAAAVYVVGGLGGRFDQTLANIYLLALPALDGIHIEVVDAEQSIRLLKPGRHQVKGQAGDTISLLPIGGATKGITTTALKYPLRDEPLQFGPARGISNVMQTNHAGIDIRQGMLLMVHTIGRA